jgi:hypothetical protein
MHRLLICLPLCLLLAPGRAEMVSLAELPDPDPRLQKPLPDKDPVTFLEKCLERYQHQKITGYTCILEKQERIDGRLQEREVIDAAYRAQPYSVFMRWKQGARRAASALYVEGENDNKMLIHPSGVAGMLRKVVSRDPEGADARAGGRYTIKEFGMLKATERTLHDWKAAQKEGTLRVEYRGVYEIHEVGDRPCYVLRRICAKPDAEGVGQVTLYIDQETWLQVGTVLKKEDGKTLVGEYLFHDIKLNPKFAADQFKPAALAP